MPFQKGHKSLRTKKSYIEQGKKMLGHFVSKETRNKLSAKSKGRKFSKDFKDADSKRLKEIWKNKEYRKKQIKAHIGQKAWNKGKPYLRGNKHWNWQGGKSFEPYGLEFNEDLKEVIRNRDGRKCFICEKSELENKEKSNVHHIDYNKKNNNPNNLISLCRKCHIKTNQKRDFWKRYFKETW